ncbi:MAG: tRNA pseudouridine(38-40) synthase TruA [Candidatus Omnitrophota bacterium]|jgi:tRNA pseudouridine38-40 synthase|nr:MAG: tRNA pseudouridine(38-40) synthase TruA [Candidatus Omnitrophota bacterium]
MKQGNAAKPNKTVNNLKRNIRLGIEYDGTNYCGWQTQTRSKLKPSIQEVIESVLTKILQEEINITGAGRTDAGVHALSQVANFKTHSKLSLVKIKKALNSLLPNDIAVKNIKEVHIDFHSRFNAKSKLYRYIIVNSSDRCVFFKKYAYFCAYGLDIKLMRKESNSLLGRHDFSSFCASSSSVRDKVRTIFNVSLKKIKPNIFGLSYNVTGNIIALDIEADGFLYNMVRNIAGTLIDIGRGRLKTGIKRILSAKDRRLAGQTAPACGLFLVKTTY